MRRLSLSWKIYIGLIMALAVSNGVQVLLPSMAQGLVPLPPLPAPAWVIALANAGIAIVLYGGLGFLGLKLAGKLGFAQIWDPAVTNRQRFLIPGVAGALLGLALIAGDVLFAPINGIGRLAHPPFPASLFASLSAGIGEEIIFRLLYVSLWVWLLSSVILRGRWQGPIFWVVAVFSALVFAAGHFPALMLLYGFASPLEMPVPLLVEVFLLNGVISMFAAYYLRKYGFLAAVGVHFWTDIIWHAVWGLV